MFRDHRIFITGGGGFIGSYLCERLAELNDIIVYDSGHRDAIKYSSASKHPRLKRIRGDVLNAADVVAAMDGADVVIHMAAIAGIDTVVTKPIRTMQVNLLGALNVLEAAAQKKANLSRVILFSTSEVYGPYVYRADEEGMTTQGAVGEPRWTYAVSKVAAEHLGFSYRTEYGLPVTMVRPFNVYGPRQVGEGAIRKFCINALKNRDIHVTGDGNQIRAWCYVEDFVDGIMALLNAEKSVGEVFNLGNPKQTATILALAEQVIRLAGSKSKILFGEQKIADVEVRVPSIQKARRLLGFEPKVGLEEGIQRTLQWCREYET
jgi:nucleoside-diphosphate-sugar epimerase